MNLKENSKLMSRKLRELRKSRGLTVDTLAAKMGENSQKVGRVERGTRNLTIDYLVKVSNALETPLSSLLDQEKNESPVPSDLLGMIVLWAEENCKVFIKDHDPKKKAYMISKIFEIVSCIPSSHQEIFLTSLLEGYHFLSNLCKNDKA